jgi:hypothetical protein
MRWRSIQGCGSNGLGLKPSVEVWSIVLCSKGVQYASRTFNRRRPTDQHGICFLISAASDISRALFIKQLLPSAGTTFDALAAAEATFHALHSLHPRCNKCIQGTILAKPSTFVQGSFIAPNCWRCHLQGRAYNESNPYLSSHSCLNSPLPCPLPRFNIYNNPECTRRLNVA